MFSRFKYTGIQNNEKYTEYIYEGIRVININKADFYRIVLVNTEQISIHNLNIDIWKLLKSYPEINKFKIRVIETTEKKA